jgi:hypothetical protein
MIAISGNGVAACCCLRLLQGVTPTTLLTEERRSRVPALMLSSSTRMLIEDAFEDKTIFEGLHTIRQRIVAWGSSDPVVLPHSGIVVAENTLVEKLSLKIPWHSVKDANPTWIIQCSGKPSPDRVEHRFGSRFAAAGEARLSKQAPQDACWIESVQNGWLFLISSGNRSGSLLAIGAPIDELLAESKLISEQIEESTASGFRFPADPRIYTPLNGSDWIACGTAALGFDPIGGEGVGNAVREAVLASAVIRAIIRGGDVATLMTHYSTRLVAGFLRHIEICASFYKSGGSSSWWSSQLDELQQGIEWTQSTAKEHPPSRYRLVNFDLESLS